MNKQSQYKYAWIIDSLDRMHNIQCNIDANILKAVFNIPLKDAELILNHFYNKGAIHE
jgi:hypothetical protein